MNCFWIKLFTNKAQVGRVTPCAPLGRTIENGLARHRPPNPGRAALPRCPIIRHARIARDEKSFAFATLPNELENGGNRPATLRL